MKKILLVTDNCEDQVNGVVVTFANIKKHAIDAGYEFHTISPSDFYYFSAPRYPEVKLSIPFSIRSKIEKIDPDFIHIATEGPIGIAAKIYCDIKKYKYSTSFHTKFPEFLNQLYGIPVGVGYGFLRWFHSKSSNILATTKSMKHLLEEKNFSAPIHVWSRGVDRKKLSSSKKRIKSDRLRVLYVGRVSKEKGLDDLCILEDKFDIQIVGDGPYRQHLQSKYKKVEFVGYKKDAELADYYRLADVFCFPSKTDTFGIVLIEAMSLGLPVAAYPVTGPIDIIEHGISGILGDCLEECIYQAAKLNKQQVKKASAIWTWQKAWEIFIKHLEQK